MAGESSQNVRNHTTIDNPTRDNPTVSKTPLKTSEGGRTRDVLKSRPPALRELAKCNVSCGGGFDQFDFALVTLTILWPPSSMVVGTRVRWMMDAADGKARRGGWGCEQGHRVDGNGSSRGRSARVLSGAGSAHGQAIRIGGVRAGGVAISPGCRGAPRWTGLRTPGVGSGGASQAHAHAQNKSAPSDGH